MSKKESKYFIALKNYRGDLGHIKKGEIYESTGKAVTRIAEGDDGKFKYQAIDVDLANPRYDYYDEVEPDVFPKLFREIDATKDSVAMKKLSKWGLAEFGQAFYVGNWQPNRDEDLETTATATLKSVKEVHSESPNQAVKKLQGWTGKMIPLEKGITIVQKWANDFCIVFSYDKLINQTPKKLSNLLKKTHYDKSWTPYPYFRSYADGGEVKVGDIIKVFENEHYGSDGAVVEYEVKKVISPTKIYVGKKEGWNPMEFTAYYEPWTMDFVDGKTLKGDYKYDNDMHGYAKGGRVDIEDLAKESDKAKENAKYYNESFVVYSENGKAKHIAKETWDELSSEARKGRVLVETHLSSYDKGRIRDIEKEKKPYIQLYSTQEWADIIDDFYHDVYEDYKGSGQFGSRIGAGLQELDVFTIKEDLVNGAYSEHFKDDEKKAERIAKAIKKLWDEKTPMWKRRSEYGWKASDGGEIVVSKAKYQSEVFNLLKKLDKVMYHRVIKSTIDVGDMTFLDVMSKNWDKNVPTLKTAKELIKMADSPVITNRVLRQKQDKGDYAYGGRVIGSTDNGNWWYQDEEGEMYARPMNDGEHPQDSAPEFDDSGDEWAIVYEENRVNYPEQEEKTQIFEAIDDYMRDNYGGLGMLKKMTRDIESVIAKDIEGNSDVDWGRPFDKRESQELAELYREWAESATDESHEERKAEKVPMWKRRSEYGWKGADGGETKKDPREEYAEIPNLNKHQDVLNLIRNVENYVGIDVEADLRGAGLSDSGYGYYLTTPSLRYWHDSDIQKLKQAFDKTNEQSQELEFDFRTTDGYEEEPEERYWDASFNFYLKKKDNYADGGEITYGQSLSKEISRVSDMKFNPKVFDTTTDFEKWRQDYLKDLSSKYEKWKDSNFGKSYADGGAVSLYFQQGSSDKEYHIQLKKENDGYVVNFQYGRRGNALKSGTKTATPVSLSEAQKIYDILLNSKVAKGYSIETSTQEQFSDNPVAPKTIHKLPQLLNMVFTAKEFINDDSYLAQEKRDGQRRMVVATPKGTMGLNKKGQEVPLTNKIIDSIEDMCTLDGEIIGDTLFAFDILALNGQNLEGEPCIERISTLNALRFGDGVKVVETAYNTEEKQELFDRLEREHREGIVFKKKDAPYTQGRPNSAGNQLKYKFYKTATFIVANLTPGKRSVGLELLDNGNRRFMGKVTIPPNKDVPNVGDFVEVRYLYAYKDGAIFQPTYLSKRTDSDLTDATIDQIIYKSDKMADGGEVWEEKELKEVIERKKKGIDNTEGESGFIVGYIKDNKGKVSKEIIDLFNAEYTQAFEEMDIEEERAKVPMWKRRIKHGWKYADGGGVDITPVPTRNLTDKEMKEVEEEVKELRKKMSQNPKLPYADGGEVWADVWLWYESGDIDKLKGSSNKVYYIQLHPVLSPTKEEEGKYVVNFEYGRKGSELQYGTKTSTPVSLSEAQKIYDDLLKSKLDKGYSINWKPNYQHCPYGSWNDSDGKYADGGMLNREHLVFDEPDERPENAKRYKMTRKSKPKKIDDFLTDMDLDIIKELEKESESGEYADGGKILERNDIQIGMIIPNKKYPKFQDKVISVTDKAVKIQSASPSENDMGSKFGYGMKPYTYRWDGTGYKRQNQYLYSDGIYSIDAYADGGKIKTSKDENENWGGTYLGVPFSLFNLTYGESRAKMWDWSFKIYSPIMGKVEIFSPYDFAHDLQKTKKNALLSLKEAIEEKKKEFDDFNERRGSYAKGGQTKKQSNFMIGALSILTGVLIGRNIKL